MPRTGSADLPLHGGRVPAWLGQRMQRLGRVVAEAIVLEYGRDELLARLAHPFWFQAFGAVMGMDWHSSGITTSVLGALKRGLAPVADEIGIYVCGGRGKHSRRTPGELAGLGDRLGLDADGLVRASRLVAKVDGAAVQDGFDLYLHGFVVSREGHWTVVQQGMRAASRTARRYHWQSAGLRSFVDDPHAAIEGEPQGEIVNLVDARAARARQAQLELVGAGPAVVVREWSRLVAAGGPRAGARAHLPPPGAPPPRSPLLPHLAMPAHHEVTAGDVVARRIAGAVAAARERGPADFAELLLVPGVGARTVFALAQVAEVLHGAPSRFTDPARFSLAHGGKDGHPYPVPLAVYDETIRVLRRAVDRAKLGEDDKLAALRRLDAASRRLEREASPAYDFDAHVARERARSAEWGGRSVGGDALAGPPARPRPSEDPRRGPGPGRSRRPPAPSEQLALPGTDSGARRPRYRLS